MARRIDGTIRQVMALSAQVQVRGTCAGSSSGEPPPSLGGWREQVVVR
jgi:hypothetical protein